MRYSFYIGAVIFGCVANGLLNSTEGFTRPLPTLLCVGAIVLCLFFLSQLVQDAPLGFVYASYAALVVISSTLVGFVVYKQTPTVYTYIGIACVLVGMTVLHTVGRHEEGGELSSS